jgi:hypothetical protein
MNAPRDPSVTQRRRRLVWRLKIQEFFASFFWTKFLGGFCRLVPLPLALLLLAGLVVGDLGSGYGIPNLIHHEDAAREIAIGLMAGHLLCLTLLLGYLRDVQRTDNPPERSVIRYGFKTLLSITLVAALLLAVNVGAQLAAWLWGSLAGFGFFLAQIRTPSLLLTAGVLLAVGMGVIAAVIIRLFAPWEAILKIQDGLRRLATGETGGRKTGQYLAWLLVQQHVAVLAHLAVVAVCYLFIRATPSFELHSPMVTGMFFLYLLIWAYGWLTLLNPRLVPAVLLGLAALFIFGGLPVYKFRPAALDDLGLYSRPADDLGERLRGPNRSTDETWQAWNERQSRATKATPDPHPKAIPVSQIRWSDQRAEPIVVIAVSGGGLRSAAWMHAVLERLEEKFAAAGLSFPRRVRLIAGASGGMLGAATWVTSLPEPNDPAGDWMYRPGPSADHRVRSGELARRYDRLTDDCLTPVIDSLFFNDVPAIFCPFPIRHDRGRALERAWSRNLQGALDVTFEKLAQGEKAGWRPSLVFSPMMIEDGRRLLISNADLQMVAWNAGNQAGKFRQTFSHDGIEFFRMFPEAWEKMPVSTAVRLSATFPYFSPAASLPTNPRRRIVDAGYYDNYGVSLAASWLFSGSHRQWILDNGSGVALIQIRDGIYSTERKLERFPEDRDNAVTTPISRGLEELTSPAEAIFHAWEAATSFRNDGLVELLTQFFAELDRVDYIRSYSQFDPNLDAGGFRSEFFTTAIFEYPGQASLSWYLTRKERREIRQRAGLDADNRPPDLRTIDAEIDALIEWWKTRMNPRTDAPIRRPAIAD